MSPADRIVDVLDGDVDLSIRVGWLADSSLHARRLGTFEQLLVAAPAWRSRVEALRSPDDLAGLPLILNTALPDPSAWRFAHASGTGVTLEARPALSIDTARGVQQAALAGIGLGILPDFAVEDDIGTGRLIRVLPEWRLPGGGIHAVFPSPRLRPERVSAFMEMLVVSMKGTAP